MMLKEEIVLEHEVSSTHECYPVQPLCITDEETKTHKLRIIAGCDGRDREIGNV
jgi:hypothetical protein